MDMNDIPVRTTHVKPVLLDDGYVIKLGGNLLVLNMTAVEILELCDGTTTVREIVDAMGTRYPDEPIGDTILGFIRTLSDNGLIAGADVVEKNSIKP